MEEKPKRSRKYTFLYILLGIILGLALVGAISALMLSAQGIPLTLDSLVQLHLANPLLLLLDFFAFLVAVLLMWVGYERDRRKDLRRSVDRLSQGQQAALSRAQESRASDESLHKRELEVAQGQIIRLQGAQAEAEKNYQAEIAVLQGQLADQEKKFQDLEAVIRRGKQQWEATFDVDNNLIVLTDEAGAILRCNRATGEAFQLGYSQIIGRGIDELFSDGTDSLQNMVPGENVEIKVSLLDAWFEISKNHLLIDAKQEGWVYIFRNVTAHRQALHEQQRLTKYYELLVKNSPLAIATLNQEGRIVDCNPGFEQMFQYTRREALGWQAELLTSPPELVEENVRMSAAADQGETVRRVTQLKRKDGMLLDAEAYWIPVIVAGRQTGSLRIYHDVSELVRQREVETQEKGSDLAEAALAVKIAEEALAIEADATETEVAPDETSIAVEAAPISVEEPAMEVDLDEPFVQEVEKNEANQHRVRAIPIEKIEGIGPVYAAKLAEVGITHTTDLLDKGASRKGREDLIKATGISSALVLKWVNMADLMRVRGIGEEYSELLEKAGVDTVKELRNRSPNHLYEALLKANEGHRLVRRTPHLSEVENWVAEAKKLEPVLTY